MHRPSEAALATAWSGPRISALGRLIARHRGNLLVRKSAGLCRRYLAWYANVDYDLSNNGEAFVLDRLAQFRPRVLFDAGANIGEWTVAAKLRCPEAEVHAFEISSTTFQTLRQNLGGMDGVACRNMGLSDAPGSIRIKQYEGLSALNTATDYPHPFPYTEIEEQVIRGDDYAREHSIAHIDFLKIDVEGMEGPVLHGFADLLARGQIDLIQFEYGRVNILTGFLLRDCYALLERHGYVVGKIYPGYVDFRPYDFADEDFLGPNYLACRKDRSDYLEAFRGHAHARSRAPVHLVARAADAGAS